MISGLNIRNFKCFESLELKLRSLTVLTGINGSGKSTALQALLLARQAAENPGNQVVKLNGPYGLALGEAHDVLYPDADPPEVEVLIEVSGEWYKYLFDVPYDRTLNLPILARDDDPPDVLTVMALSVAFAHTLTLRGQGVACLVFGTCPRRGFVITSNETGDAEIFFFADTSTLIAFWRFLYELEDIQETTFFTLASRAFPSLLFNPDLSFRRFEGTYRDLRPRAVSHLSVLNDHFLPAYRAANGIAKQIEATLASAGCPGISPESPNTHKNERAMSLRDVEYQGSMIRCEWHTKIEPNRNRIHFGFGGRFKEMIFIGIFVDHLDT